MIARSGQGRTRNNIYTYTRRDKGNVNKLSDTALQRARPCRCVRRRATGPACYGTSAVPRARGGISGTASGTKGWRPDGGRWRYVCANVCIHEGGRRCSGTRGGMGWNLPFYLSRRAAGSYSSFRRTIWREIYIYEPLRLSLGPARGGEGTNRYTAHVTWTQRIQYVAVNVVFVITSKLYYRYYYRYAHIEATDVGPKIFRAKWFSQKVSQSSADSSARSVTSPRARHIVSGARPTDDRRVALNHESALTARVITSARKRLCGRHRATLGSAHGRGGVIYACACAYRNTVLVGITRDNGRWTGRKSSSPKRTFLLLPTSSFRPKRIKDFPLFVQK